MGDAFHAHDAQKMASFLSDDAVVYSYSSEEGHSKSDMVTGLTGFFAAFSDADMAPLRVWIKGNVAVVDSLWAGSMTGDFMGEKASHKPVGGQMAQVFWFTDDGLIKEMHRYSDGAGLMAQVKGAKGAPPVPKLPTNPPEVHVAKGTPDEDKLADLGKAADTNFGKHEVKDVMDTVADDADFWMNITGLPATKGKKDMTKELASWFKAIPDQTWTNTNSWGIDGFAITEDVVAGTQKGPLGPVKASNKPVAAWHWLHIYQPTADGKLQHGWAYANMVELLKETGAIKKPADKPAEGGGAKSGDKGEKPKSK
jgi:ketosteroid isomerase-like protein